MEGESTIFEVPAPAQEDAVEKALRFERQAAQFEALSKFVQGSLPKKFRQIFELLLTGARPSEIAELLGYEQVRTLQVKLDVLYAILRAYGALLESLPYPQSVERLLPSALTEEQLRLLPYLTKPFTLQEIAAFLGEHYRKVQTLNVQIQSALHSSAIESLRRYGQFLKEYRRHLRSLRGKG